MKLHDILMLKALRTAVLIPSASFDITRVVQQCDITRPGPDFLAPQSVEIGLCIETVLFDSVALRDLCVG